MPETVRDWIIESIQQILAGRPFTSADYQNQPAKGWDEIESKSRIVKSSQAPAHSAWIALRQWVDDEDIRVKDPEYAEMQKVRLRALLERIK